LKRRAGDGGGSKEREETSRQTEMLFSSRLLPFVSALDSDPCGL
jgi:hypothetical protein